MAEPLLPPGAQTRARKGPPSWWWFLGPAVLAVLAVLVGAGAFVWTLNEVSTTYDEFHPDGEPHAISVPTGHDVTLMAPEGVDRAEWRCRVTDDEGQPLDVRDNGGSFTFSNDEGSWESLLTFDPSEAATRTDEVPTTVTVVAQCNRLGDGPGQTVRLVKAPALGAVVGRVLVMILGPLVLGGAAFVWTVVLVVLQVVKRTGA